MHSSHLRIRERKSEKTLSSEMALARVTNKEVYLISADVWITLILPLSF